MTTPAVDLAMVLYLHLPEAERDELFARISEHRVSEAAGSLSETAVIIASLRRAAEIAGDDMSPALYKATRRDLAAQGVEIEGFSRIVRHFGSWRRAKEALSLSDSTTVRRIEARFRYRRVGKVWRYTEQTLGETLERCVEHYGRPPMVAEFDWWRQRELELAAAQGNDALHLPSATPYRRRWGTWEDALQHFGYPPEQTAARHEQP